MKKDKRKYFVASLNENMDLLYSDDDIYNEYFDFDEDLFQYHLSIDIDISLTLTDDISSKEIYKQNKLSDLITSIIIENLLYGVEIESLEDAITILEEFLDRNYIIGQIINKKEFYIVKKESIFKNIEKCYEDAILYLDYIDNDPFDDDFNIEDYIIPNKFSEEEFNNFKDELEIEIKKCFTKFDFGVIGINGEVWFDVNKNNNISFGLNEMHNIMFYTKLVSYLHSKEPLILYLKVCTEKDKDLNKQYVELFAFHIHICNNCTKIHIQYISANELKESFYEYDENYNKIRENEKIVFCDNNENRFLNY